MVLMRRKRGQNTWKWKSSVIVGLVVFSLIMMNCTSVRMTMTPRSSLEQKLLFRGLERAIAHLHIEQFKGKRVALDLTGLAKDDLPFAKEFICIWLIKNGIQVVNDQKEIDFRLKVLAKVLAVDQSETLIGTPEFTLLGIPIPAIVIYRNRRNRGRAELKMYAFGQSSEMLVDEIPEGIGEAKHDRYTILFIINWASTDLGKKPEEPEK